jgi:pimeloyl-ACP methyl ester carboxylesterase
MPKLPRPRAADVRGAVRLATDATTGLTDLVEAVHQRIARVPGLGQVDPDGRTGGITGLVYRSVRGVTRLVGGSLDGLLGLLGPALEPHGEDAAHSAEREAVVAALNGVMGDYLESTSNPLATPMSLCVDGLPLSLGREALAQGLPQAQGTALILLHGLCMNDHQWLREGQHHGQTLARALPLTTLSLRYNSGQHISLNGRALAALLEQLTQVWPVPLQRIILLGHSMGGLVARSALHHGAQAGQRWPGLVSDLVCLGSPHHGAPLERAGNWVDMLLGVSSYAAPFARLGQLRSAGITDLRHGFLLDEDWLGRDRFSRGASHQQPVPLPGGVRCFALAGRLGDGAGDMKDQLLGDGLVPLDSALGRHRDPARTLNFPPERQWVAQGVNHLALLSDAGVAEQLQRWLAPTSSARP